jgi:uncharacterized membrane protein
MNTMKNTNKLLNTIITKFWFLPVIYSVLAFFLAILSIWLENNNTVERVKAYVPNVLLTDVFVTQTILGSFATAILTMTTITFSSIMVVLTTYSSQFSPRTLQDFISDRVTQRVLGVFVGGFLYSAFMLLFLKGLSPSELFVAPTLAVVIAVICISFFIFFIQHVATWIQVNNLIHTITTRAIKTINDTYLGSFVNRGEGNSTSDKWEIEELIQFNEKFILSDDSGYLQTINLKALIKQTNKDDIIIQLQRQIGEYIVKQTPILVYWAKDNKKVDHKKYLELLKLGSERVTTQDVEFGIQKLVEIALRAISPAINDPHTAINCINRLGTILATLAKTPFPDRHYFDTNKNLRVILEIRDFPEYLYKTFYQIRHFGKQDISVMAALVTALQFIAESNNDHDINDLVWEFSKYIISTIDVNQLHELDRNYINHKLTHLSRKTNHETEFSPM